MDDVAWPQDAVEVGKIVDAWGVKGWIKVQPYASVPEALFSSRRWFLQPPDGSGALAQAARRRPVGGTAGAGSPPAFPGMLRITDARDHGDVVVASAQGIADRTQAEALRGARVFVSRASFPTAEAGEYYWVDLIGLAVVNRQGESLGTVADLLDTGAHSVLRVLDASSDPALERLIPFVAAYVDDVDLPNRRITVDWGLDY